MPAASGQAPISSRTSSTACPIAPRRPASSTATNRHVCALPALAALTAMPTMASTSSRGTGSGA